MTELKKNIKEEEVNAELSKSGFIVNRVWLVVLGVIAGVLIGLLIGGGSSSPMDNEGHGHPGEGEAAAQVAKEEIWTCSMHPQIRQPKPGKCPLCGMDLIPAASGEEKEGPREVKLSPNAIKLAEVRTEKVTRRFAEREIRLVGKVDYDERRVKYITTRVPGRIDRLFVDYTGIGVRKGDHLVALYSPELISAQQELLQAAKTLKNLRSGVSPGIKRTARRTLDATREKLRLWGLLPNQISAIEKAGKPNEHLTIYSPISGVVVQKQALEGMYVKTGTPIYRIADLSRVWIKLDAYESDLTWLRYGQKVTFETEAYPGEVFEGLVAFIDPVLDAATRTVKIRVNVDNKQRKLKPGLFVRAVVRSRLTESGTVMEPALAGKWISPMHPEIVKDGPGSCDICGMALVKAETLGFTASEDDAEAPMVIPVSAPLITGKRAVVYVAIKGKDGHFEGREIVLGPRAGDVYLVKEGLEEGENVVVNGAFKIDSDLQLKAKPSMMNPEGEPGMAGGGHDHHGHSHDGDKTGKAAAVNVDKVDKKTIPNAFRLSVDAVAKGYFAMQHALSNDSLEEAKKEAKGFLQSLKAVDMRLLKGSTHTQWMKLEPILKTASERLAAASDIEAARVQLEILTAPSVQAITIFGSGKSAVYKFHCPMAFNDKGAYWLQDNTDTRNPYFGESMLICKDSVEPLVEGKKE